MDIFFILLWVAATLATGTVSVLLGKRYGVYVPVAVMASLSVITAVLVAKFVTFGPFTTTAAVVVFSMNFLMTDLISEIWGKKYALYAVWSGFIASLIFLVTSQIAIMWPSAEFAVANADAFELLFSTTPRLVIAGILTYLISQTIDIYVFHWIKQKTGEKLLWLRNNASTFISQFFDTIIITILGFAGVVPTSALLGMFLGSWTIKIIIALVDTPFIYAGKYLFNRR